jgi:hypothetical protein
LEQNGTKDMMGNVWEWNEAVVNTGGDYASRGLRAGSFHDFNTYYLDSSYRLSTEPTFENYYVGFRVASVEAVVPEPTTFLIWSLLGTLGIGLAWWRKRKAV